VIPIAMRTLLESKNTAALLTSLVAELAKATNELRCARQDIQKAQGRLQFVLATVHVLQERDLRDEITEIAEGWHAASLDHKETNR